MAVVIGGQKDKVLMGAEYSVWKGKGKESLRRGSVRIWVRSHKNGEAGIAVTLEFKAVGKLETFQRVELQIGEGKDRIMSAPLLASQPTPGTIVVRFSAYPAYLDKSILTIVVIGNNPLGGEGYRIKVKDFIDGY